MRWRLDSVTYEVTGYVCVMVGDTLIRTDVPVTVTVTSDAGAVLS